ncbi:unnamed protein product [Closterium sp. Naga37s-1]|nr:unnamed protein product [Closterium sp. Naga37s-1]
MSLLICSFLQEDVCLMLPRPSSGLSHSHTSFSFVVVSFFPFSSFICSFLQEDVCLMLPRPSSSSPSSHSSSSPTSSSSPSTSSSSSTPPLCLVSGAVLFPNGWILPEKLGLPTAHIHTPVPLYESTISRAVDKFLNNLEPGSPFARSNWTITDDPRLFRPISEASYASMVQAKAGLSEQRLQKEQQQQQQQQQEGEKVLITLPHPSPPFPLPFTHINIFLFHAPTFTPTGAVLFTIRTHMKPLRVFSGRCQLAADVARAMDALPGEIRRYKMIGGRLADVAREYLIRCSEGLA